MINVSKTFLPPLEEYSQYLKKIWESGWVTNHGPYVQEFQNALKVDLGVGNIRYVNNGTVALQIAIKALGLTGEVVTTPFSYVATTSSLVWEGCRPIFADIDFQTLNIDPDRIEDSITSRTTAILATHVYGNPCEVDRIEEIARRKNLKVIYDAAHCYGTQYNGQSILNYGDISTLSFHATKLLHTVEGGAVVCANDEIAHRVSYLMNFGHQGPEDFEGIGINAKPSEFHAAMGLCLLPRVQKFIERRRAISELYDQFLLDPIYELRRPKIDDRTKYNFAYYPVIFPTQEKLIKVKEKLNQNSINPRRYFYPSLSQLKYVDSFNVPIAEDISTRILCLPIYYELSNDDVHRISKLILQSLS